MWKGPVMTTCMHTQTYTHTMVLHASRKVKVKPLTVFIYLPFTELKKIMPKLLLRGG